ncbi:hypothetical protein R1sor_006287 [Riccia sorocarpa]|uniref:NB-ARC domain-containing protein n=1 Tax=Riccia sorocarpa TaxID=122646 RepID=A0ABD3HR92_9MARC
MQLEKKWPLLVPEVIVGVDGLLTEILEKHIRDHKFIGLCRTGGVGKTTLAKLIFNKIYSKFEFSCFIEEISHIPGTNDEVKKRVWERMFRRGVPVCGSFGADEWYQVRGRSLFVVFDDVQDTHHVKLLQEIAHDNGMRESRFIVTGRDKNRLRDCGQEIHICPLDRLENEDANKLFITHAFPGQQEPPKSWRPVAKQVVDGCEGLPLTLDLMGKWLRDKPIDYWEEIPIALRECDPVIGLEEKVWAKLQLSYDTLPGTEKHIFLDIASFSVFREVPFSIDDALQAWTSIYGRGRNRLQTLEDMSLVRIDHDEVDDRRYFYMHEHLKNIGQKIARLEGMSFSLSEVRTWSTLGSDPGAEVQYQYPFDDQVIFQGGQELGKIVAHRVSITKISMQVYGQTCAFCIMREVWSKLTAIRYLDLSVRVSDCCQYCMTRGCPLPNTLVLFHLNLNKNGNVVISGGVGTNFPNDTASTTTGTLVLTGCTALVKLDLVECVNVDLGGLNELKRLQRLQIIGCGTVGNWPTSFKRDLTCNFH